MKPKSNHEVVISGMSGIFPCCNSVGKFKRKLFTKTSLINESEKAKGDKGQDRTYYTARIPSWNRFDNTFFGIPTRVINNTDPLHGQILERSFEAMVDAGMNPFSLNGRNIGVVASMANSDAERVRYQTGFYLDGYGMVGHARAMLSNRISYYFNFTGTSFTCDNSFVSSLQALEMAAKLVAQGVVEAAVVISTNLCNVNDIHNEYHGLGLSAPDGKCSPFDKDAKGLCRSEGSVAFFLQRAEDAKRQYCSLVKTQTRYLGNRNRGYLRIDPLFETFLREFYMEEDIDPATISYIEEIGCCIKDMDSEELNAIYNVFHRRNPLLIGSVSGNLGNAEAVSGFMSLVKVIIAMECGVIPPTINYKTPNPFVKSLSSGELQPVTEARPVPGDLMAVNCVSLTGSAAHVVVRRSSRPKSTGGKDRLPRLVTLQARNEEGIKSVIEKINKLPVDVEFAAMVNDVFHTQVPAYLWRGFTLMPTAGTSVQYQLLSPSTRPVWFVFSGMGSQWVGMGRDLMKIPVFAATIDRCDRVLRPKGLDIKHILTTDDPHIFDDILNSFVGLSAIQVGLVDILKTVGVTPDGMIGHSLGEIGCGYADGCLTAEQIVLASYARGRASNEAVVIPGLMAAVGLGYNSIKDRVPPTIDVACHNSADSCTLSGPTEDMIQFTQHLKDSGVFAKTVNAGGIPFHSRYIPPVGVKFLQYLKEIIPEPKVRSSRWVSSSVPESQWNTRESQLCSAEYHTNNLLSPVLFEEACRSLPNV